MQRSILTQDNLLQIIKAIPAAISYPPSQNPERRRQIEHVIETCQSPEKMPLGNFRVPDYFERALDSYLEETAEQLPENHKPEPVQQSLFASVLAPVRTVSGYISSLGMFKSSESPAEHYYQTLAIKFALWANSENAQHRSHMDLLVIWLTRYMNMRFVMKFEHYVALTAAIEKLGIFDIHAAPAGNDDEWEKSHNFYAEIYKTFLIRNRKILDGKGKFVEKRFRAEAEKYCLQQDDAAEVVLSNNPLSFYAAYHTGHENDAIFKTLRSMSSGW